MVEELRGDQELVEEAEAILSSEAIDASLDKRETAAQFAMANEATFGAIRDEARERLAPRVGALDAALGDDVLAISAGWPSPARRDFLARYLGFPFWDVLVFPVQGLSEVDERGAVEVVRLSPLDATLLESTDSEGRDRPKLEGVSLAHFGAFFSREGRENDYLWGRLDAAERLVSLLLDDPSTPGLGPPDVSTCQQAFTAILGEERPSLTHVRDLIDRLQQQVDNLT